MTEHSPTPWRLEDDRTIVDASGRAVYCLPSGWEEDENATISKEDIQHIVDCVNRCHELESLLRARWREITEQASPHFQNPVSTTDNTSTTPPENS